MVYSHLFSSIRISAISDGANGARLDGAAAGIHATIASQPAPFEEAITRRVIDAIRLLDGQERWHGDWQEGHELSVDAAIDYALR